MKILFFLIGILISSNTMAWFSLSLDELEWYNGSGSIYGIEKQTPQHMRMMQDQDMTNYYLHIQLEGIKPEEVDIQRQGLGISIHQVRGRKEKSESAQGYWSSQSYSSFTRHLTLPPDADPDVSKMKRENAENFIRLIIPKRLYQPWDSGYY